MEERKIMNTRQAAEFLTVSSGTLQNWRSKKYGPPYHKLGGRVIYFTDELEKYARTSSTSFTGKGAGKNKK